MTSIIVVDSGINWQGYTEYELGESLAEGTYKATVLSSERYHKFNEDQGAGKHPAATHIYSGGSVRPILRGYAKMTEAEKAREQESFDFRWSGWERWCKRLGLDPHGPINSIQVIVDRASGEQLTLLLEESN